MSGGKEVVLMQWKYACENKPLYGLNYEQNEVRVRKYSFACPDFGYIITGENTRGSTYG